MLEGADNSPQSVDQSDRNKRRRVKLPDANAQQRHIIDTIVEGNVCVDAVAGGGKTTLCLKIAERYPSRKVLLLTFNARLKTETRQRAQAALLDNLEAHSFHAFGVKYYKDPCRNDVDLEDILKSNLKPRRQRTFDFIIVDEAQDLKDLFYRFVLKVFADVACPSRTHLCVLGDAYQMVYEVYGADARFLQHCPECFPLNSARWFSRPMHTTYRLTRSMVHFINKVVLGKERLLCSKTHDEKVDLFEIHWGGGEESLSRDLTNLWNNLVGKGYKDGEIMILAPSVESKSVKSSVSRLAHYLCNRGHAVYVDHKRDDYCASEEEVANKILFTNFVKAKGLERRLVVVLSFDAGYFKYFAKEVSPQRVTNAMYVALTRAKEKLVLVKDRHADYLPFLRTDVMLSPSMEPFLQVYGSSRIQTQPERTDRDVDVISVVKLCSLPNLFLYQERLATLVRFRVLSRSVGCRKDEGTLLALGKEFNEQMGICEDTSCINGIAMPLHYFMKQHPEACKVLRAHATEALRKMAKEMKSADAKALLARLCSVVDSMDDAQQLREIATDPSKVLLLAALLNCERDHLFVPLLQLPRDFLWLPASSFAFGEQRLRATLQDQTACELEVETKLEWTSEAGFKYVLEGVLDCQTDQTVYEFKCTQELTFSHQLQTALYAFMTWQIKSAHRGGGTPPRVKLYNVNTNELQELVSEKEELWQVLSLLLHAKENPIRKISTEDFLNTCQETLINAGVGAAPKPDTSAALRGYPILCINRTTEPDEDDEVTFDELPDADQAAIQDWYRESCIDAASPYQRWRALMDAREEARLHGEADVVRSRIDALGVSTDITLLFDENLFRAPLITGIGGSLACGKCGLRLPKSESGYLQKPQRIYCAHCAQTLAEKGEIERQPRSNEEHAPLLRVAGKREFVMVHVELPGQRRSASRAANDAF